MLTGPLNTSLINQGMMACVLPVRNEKGKKSEERKTGKKKKTTTKKQENNMYMYSKKDETVTLTAQLCIPFENYFVYMEGLFF